MSHVFCFDVPIHAEDYVHRIGRTGRAGLEGRSFMLASPEDGDFVAVHSHVRQRPGDLGAAVVHIFRFDGDVGVACILLEDRGRQKSSIFQILQGRLASPGYRIIAIC